MAELCPLGGRPVGPQDMLAIETDFRWYLTGRFAVIVLPELAREQVHLDEPPRSLTILQPLVPLIIACSPSPAPCRQSYHT